MALPVVFVGSSNPLEPSIFYPGIRPTCCCELSLDIASLFPRTHLMRLVDSHLNHWFKAPRIYGRIYGTYG